MHISDTITLVGTSAGALPPAPTNRPNDHGGRGDRPVAGSGHTESIVHASTPACRLVNFAELIDVMVSGNPTPHQLGRLATHFRTINAIPDGSHALRLLRLVTDRCGQYPTIVFGREHDHHPVRLTPHLTDCPRKEAGPGSRAPSHGIERAVEASAIAGLVESVDTYLQRAQLGLLAGIGTHGPRRRQAGTPRATAAAVPRAIPAHAR